MQVYGLTSIGKSLASNPTSNLTPAMRVLYMMKRNGGQASDERIKTILSDGEGYVVIQKLLGAKAIQVVG